ncbi:S4 domain-containing protein [Brevibacillus reuszeri]|uniref:S4 domain-containing protein n=1 Tax=Brevibacillus reuszeri TaxID=54915 RepID=UPI00289C97BC|nr:S4 domain-containing protein [Brevibacillus reuszeri]
MLTNEHTWVLIENKQEQEVLRYCSNCGRTVPFFDTMIRRHNSNGKNVYRFAIYKCVKNHTWNEKLATYKAYTDHREVLDAETFEQPFELPRLHLSQYLENGVQEVTILIKHVEGRFRIDKLLAEQIEGWSRNQVIHRIKAGQILVNHQIVKPGFTLSARDTIKIRVL